MEHSLVLRYMFNIHRMTIQMKKAHAYVNELQILLCVQY